LGGLRAWYLLDSKEGLLATSPHTGGFMMTVRAREQSGSSGRERERERELGREAK
jgi:hypothetical protein